VKSLQDIFVESFKKRYTFVDDGYYSNIFIDSLGEYNTFAKAKKQLVTNTRQRVQDFKAGMQDLKKAKESDLLGEGEFFTINYDGMYTSVERTSSDEYKSFKEAKKVAYDYLHGQYSEWHYAWKRATSLKEEDVEVKDW